MTDDALDPVVDMLIDEEPIDWTALESRSLDLQSREAIRNLRAIAGVARMHRRPSESRGAPPFEWGPLHVLDRMGSGAHGTVYRARDPELERDVALKIFHDASSGSIAEGRLLARVRHPNVVAVYGADRTADGEGIWMELVPGETLFACVSRQGPLEPIAAASIVGAVGRGLEAIHAAGLLHRDVKAQNVVIEEGTGRVVLMDLGAGDSIETLRSAMQGTPLYVAPEVLSGRAPSSASDVFSLGVLLFYATTGEYPANGRTLEDVRRNHATGRVADAVAHAPRPLRSTLQSALEIDPARRCASAAAFATELEHLVRRRRRRVGQAGLTVAAVAVSAIVGWLWLAARNTPRARPVDVLVARFSNATGDPAFDGMAERRVTREMARAAFIHFVPEPRVSAALRQMRLRRQSADGETAVEIAQRDGGIRAVITGTVSRHNHGYAIAEVLRDGVTGLELARFSADAADVTEMSRQLEGGARRLRDALQRLPDPAAGGVSLEHATVRSIRALRLYSASHAQGNYGSWRNALPLVRDALEVDPDFPTARIWLAWCLHNTAQPREVGAEATRALADAERDGLDDRERLWIAGSERWLAGDRDAAARNYEALLAIEPTHFWAVSNLSVYYRQRGRFADASALKDPFPDDARIESLLKRGEYAAAEREAEILRRTEPAEIAWLVEANERWVQDDIAGAYRSLEAEAHAIATLPDPDRDSMVIEVTGCFAGLGRPLDAHWFIDTIADPGSRALARLYVAVHAGDSAAVEREADQVLPTSVNDLAKLPIGWQNAIWYAAHGGDARRADDARRVATQLGGYTDDTDRAEIERVRGHYDASIVLALHDLSMRPSAPEPGTLRDVRTLARSYLARGAVADAIAILERTLRQEHETFQPLWLASQWNNVELLLAESYLTAGRVADARRLLLHLEHRLAVADPNYPLAVRLRQLEGK